MKSIQRELHIVHNVVAASKMYEEYTVLTAYCTLQRRRSKQDL